MSTGTRSILCFCSSVRPAADAAWARCQYAMVREQPIASCTSRARTNFVRGKTRPELMEGILGLERDLVLGAARLRFLLRRRLDGLVEPDGRRLAAEEQDARRVDLCDRAVARQNPSSQFLRRPIVPVVQTAEPPAGDDSGARFTRHRGRATARSLLLKRVVRSIVVVVSDKLSHECRHRSRRAPFPPASPVPGSTVQLCSESLPSCRKAAA